MTSQESLSEPTSTGRFDAREALPSAVLRAAPLQRPRLSFGMPVRNGEQFIRRALDSILSQDVAEIEVVIGDNVSDDRTEEICRDYAVRDARVRYFRNEEDLGQVENFNRTFRLSRGDAFRWISSNDWIEPGYVAKCLAALDACPSAIGVTTLWRLVDDQGNVEFEEYLGRRVDSPDRLVRLSRLMWLLQPGRNRLYFDPMYTMLRRDVVERTGLLHASTWADRGMALKLSLQGPFAHVHECLANRRWVNLDYRERVRRIHRQNSSLERFPAYYTMYADLAALVRRAPLPFVTRAASLAIIAAYWVRYEVGRPFRRVLAALRRRFKPRQ